MLVRPSFRVFGIGALIAFTLGAPTPAAAKFRAEDAGKIKNLRNAVSLSGPPYITYVETAIVTRERSSRVIEFDSLLKAVKDDLGPQEFDKVMERYNKLTARRR